MQTAAVFELSPINKYKFASNLCPRQGAGGGVNCCAKIIRNKEVLCLKKNLFLNSPRYLNSKVVPGNECLAWVEKNQGAKKCLLLLSLQGRHTLFLPYGGDVHSFTFTVTVFFSLKICTYWQFFYIIIMKQSDYRLPSKQPRKKYLKKNVFRWLSVPYDIKSDLRI
jgi:hypothetical protein